MANMELVNLRPSTPDAIIREFCSFINALSGNVQRAWETASSPIFDISVQVEAKPPAHQLKLSAKTVALAAGVGAGITVTTYSPRGGKSGTPN